MKKTTASIILLLVYLSSLFAYGVYYQSPKQKVISLASLLQQRIKTTDLTENEVSTLLLNGYTVIKFRFDSSMSSLLMKDFLERKVNSYGYSSQTVLVELPNYQAGYIVEIISPNGEKSLVNSTQEEVTKNLCNLLVSKPTECALIG